MILRRLRELFFGLNFLVFSDSEEADFATNYPSPKRLPFTGAFLFAGIRVPAVLKMVK